jgi:hypothetical protein
MLEVRTTGISRMAAEFSQHQRIAFKFVKRHGFSQPMVPT